MRNFGKIWSSRIAKNDLHRQVKYVLAYEKLLSFFSCSIALLGFPLPSYESSTSFSQDPSLLRTVFNEEIILANISS